MTDKFINLRSAKIVGDGNSITAGVHGVGSDWPRQLKHQMDANGLFPEIINLGVSGQNTINMINDATTQVDTLYDPSRINILFAWEGSNIFGDPNYTNSPIEVYKLMRDYCIHRRSRGFYVVVIDSFKRGDYLPQDPQFVEHNRLIRTNWREFADAYVDVRATFSGAKWEPWGEFMLDGIHPTPTGNVIIAERFYQAIKFIRQRPIPAQSGGLDPDALALLTAAGISDSTQRSALDGLAKGLKTNGTWSKYVAIYPLLGGTADSHKLNLKDPRDLNEAYRVTWSGVLTHDAQGVTGGGGFGNTNYSGPVASLSCYSPSSSTANDVAIGAAIGGTTLRSRIWPKWTDSFIYAEAIDNTPPNSLEFNIAALPVGHLDFSRKPSVETFLSRNGIKVAEVAAVSTPYFSGHPVYLLGFGRNNAPENVSYRNYKFFSISDYRTQAEVAADYAVIQAYQTALGRAV